MNFDSKEIEKILGPGKKYNFDDFLVSGDRQIEFLSKKIMMVYKALDNVVDSKSSYLEQALLRESTDKDALLDVLSVCRSMIDEALRDPLYGDCCQDRNRS